ncbi:C2H2 type zinc finger domain protein [Aspergillus clavatus NRRL 1]|uniref:C2H2 type zinc finger domain protein n=1 Tax=Aspergillus clavatus (strain ATCC 1007 / CBS 513.65 / DSM 816 / NCTC 3887 / NRRL 1 / QM 1276 / 107) TaxID=344612 RepID=A1CD41_ASPCL|nr:C2H2 type zinc finger domain protein [Aspergillus clavatus NRRL 1]EAW12448.1 C2H2 type zinc finger domain protein [Aspergillus clavatus NRRL 1]
MEAGDPWMALPLFKREHSPDVLSLSHPLIPDDIRQEYPESPGLLAQLRESTELQEYPSSDLTSSNDPFFSDGTDSRTSNNTSINPPEWTVADASASIASYPTTCPYPRCKSTLQFTRAREFHRHYKQHFKRFFCRYRDCPQSEPEPNCPRFESKSGFATRKDRARHEAKHNPEIRCDWRDNRGEQCTRVFSRMDNMRDHVRRIHLGRGGMNEE